MPETPPNTESIDYMDKLKSRIWTALAGEASIEGLEGIVDRPITALDIYYLLERWGILTLWNAYDLEPAGEKKLLTLEGVSPHYRVFDLGSSLVAAPIDLFSYKRTLEDGVMTVRAVAQEAFKREWTIELAGFEKLVRAAWVEVQLLNDKHGKHLEVINYNPSPDDVKLYAVQSMRAGLGQGQ